MMTRLLVVALLLLSSVSFSQTSPLIMKHADSLAVARTRGTLLLQGRVYFVHDSVQFRTQRATWNKSSEVVQCDGYFRLNHPSGYINANTGVYQKKQGLATATGNVHAGDSAHSYYFTGEHLIYDREKEILTMPQKPVLYQFEKNKEGGKDTVKVVARRIVYNKKDSFAEAHDQVVITQKEVTIAANHINYDRNKDYAAARDSVTLVHKDITISADVMNYNRKDDYAEAFNHVKLVQNDMVVTCDTGYFNHGAGWLSMKGNPAFDMKNYHLTGDSIFLVLDSAGKTMKSALVIRNAHGIQQEEAKRNAPGSVTEAFGDTLYAEFDGNKIERLYVNLNARGFFYETDLKDFRNLMDGDRLDLYFNKGKMDKAIVSGKAQSTYFYVKKDRSVSGKNEATGDTIHILFDAQKNAVKSLKLLGNSAMASGRYVDMEKERRNKELAEKDSLAKAAAQKELERDKAALAKGDSTKIDSDSFASKNVLRRVEELRKAQKLKKENTEKNK